MQRHKRVVDLRELFYDKGGSVDGRRVLFEVLAHRVFRVYIILNGVRTLGGSNPVGDERLWEGPSFSKTMVVVPSGSTPSTRLTGL